MPNHLVKTLPAFIILTLLTIWLSPLLHFHSSQAQAPVVQALKDNEELARLFREDQADRKPPSGKPIDWAIVAGRDKARLARVKELYTRNGLQTGADYYHAAMLLQHGGVPEDYLLAHEFCVVANSRGKNDRDTRWLAAASEDRFLMNIGRPQRFGTQYQSVGPNSPMKLYTVDSGVTDELRRMLDVPSLAKAREREAEMNRK